MTFERKRTQCVFCKTPLEVRIDPECPGGRLEKLLPLAACNRCADHKHRMRPMRDRLKNLCEHFCIIRATTPKEITPKYQQNFRDDLVTITKRIMNEITDYNHLQNFWQEDFVIQLLEHPDKWGMILRTLEDGILKMGSVVPAHHQSPDVYRGCPADS